MYLLIKELDSVLCGAQCFSSIAQFGCDALSDFRTADGIRKGEDYMNNYFVSRYGAIKEVDFSQILEKFIAGSEVYADA